MTPQTSLYLYLKLGIVGLALLGVFVLAALGRIDATVAIGSVVTLVTGLSVALGISASGQAQATAMTAHAVAITQQTTALARTGELLKSKAANDPPVPA